MENQGNHVRISNVLDCHYSVADVPKSPFCMMIFYILSYWYVQRCFVPVPSVQPLGITIRSQPLLFKNVPASVLAMALNRG